MKKSSAHRMTATDVAAHQQRSFGAPRCTCKPVGAYHAPQCPVSLFTSELRPLRKDAGYVEALDAAGKSGALPQPVQMSRPEKEMGMMLEAQKREGEIVDYRFQGMSLAYSPDPETGILLRYKCDYVVIVAIGHKARQVGVEIETVPFAGIKIIECKGHGKHAISAAAKLRFKGAKAAWPMFKFEMHQRGRDGQWRRVL